MRPGGQLRGRRILHGKLPPAPLPDPGVRGQPIRLRRPELLFLRFRRCLPGGVEQGGTGWTAVTMEVRCGRYGSWRPDLQHERSLAMGDRSGRRAGAGQPAASGSSAAGSGQGPATARGRRAVLAGAAAAGAGAAAGLAGRAGVASAAPASAAAVLLGRANTETSATSVSNARGTALSAATGSDGHSALAGADTSGKGGHGVRGTSKNGTGVAGTSTHGYGLSGTSASDGWGVYGSSTNGLGVYGSSTNFTGVAGVSNNSTGVEGTTSGEGQSGVAGIDESTRGGT